MGPLGGPTGALDSLTFCGKLVLILSVSPILPPPELVRADYSIYRYTDQIYKVIRFKTTAIPLGIRDHSKFEKHDSKLPAALSRARRVVLELALCNDWEYFCTFTISKDKHDRYNLKEWYKKFTQWLRDQRKKGYDIKYLLVPERHKDGAWHMHGFFSGISDLLVTFAEERKQGMKIPDKLVNCGFWDWPDYREKFGFCSFGFIHNRVAASFYVVKYLTKELQSDSMPVGLHLYYATHGLNKSERHGEIFGSCSYLDQFLENDYDFCKTGMTQTKHGLSWDFALEYMAFEPLYDKDYIPDDVTGYVDDFFSMEQMTFDDYSVSAAE